MKNLYVFGRLFAEPSFTEGVSRCLTSAGHCKEYGDSETERKPIWTKLKVIGVR